MYIDREATLKTAEKLLRQGRLDAAIAEYVRLTGADPGDWTSVNALGDLYVRAGRIDRAADQFARVGDHLLRDGALAKAAAVYRKIVRIAPGDPRGPRGLGLVAERQDAARPLRKGGPVVARDDPDARMLAAREAQDAGDVPRACALLIEAADLYTSQGRHSDALAAVAEASGIEPANADYRGRLLRTLLDQGELMQARYVARAAPELVMVADAFERQGRGAEALDTLAEAALADPEDQSLRERILRQFVAGGDLDRARRLARTPADLLIVAEALNRDGRGAEVVDLLAEAVDREPHNAPLREQLVTACLAAGDVDRARGAARSARDWMLLSDAMGQQGRPADALAALREATQRDPHDASLHASFVHGCVEAGDLDRARQAARTKAEIVEVADALDGRGHGEAALAMRADALRGDPEDPELRVRLIRDYVRAGDRDRAHALLTLEVAGDDPELVLLLTGLEFGIGRLDAGRKALAHLVAVRVERRRDVLDLGIEVAAAGQTEAGYVCAEVFADAACGEDDWDSAVAGLQEFVGHVPDHVPSLLKLIEVCVDGGFHDAMMSAQGKLADAYLRVGQAANARVVAEDLVLRAPWERSSVERCLRALVLCHDPDPERTIANLLSTDGSLTLEDL